MAPSSFRPGSQVHQAAAPPPGAMIISLQIWGEGGREQAGPPWIPSVCSGERWWGEGADKANPSPHSAVVHLPWEEDTARGCSRQGQSLLRSLVGKPWWGD